MSDDALEYLVRMASMSLLEYWNSLLFELKMTSAMSQSHRTLSSIAFFIRPFFRFVNVTCGGLVRRQSVGLCDQQTQHLTL